MSYFEIVVICLCVGIVVMTGYIAYAMAKIAALNDELQICRRRLDGQHEELDMVTNSIHKIEDHMFKYIDVEIDKVRFDIEAVQNSIADIVEQSNGMSEAVRACIVNEGNKCCMESRIKQIEESVESLRKIAMSNQRYWDIYMANQSVCQGCDADSVCENTDVTPATTNNEEE